MKIWIALGITIVAAFVLVVMWYDSQKSFQERMAHMGWLHVDRGLYFRRGEGGVVQIGQGQSFESVEVMQEIPASQWASVVASVCYRGENGNTFNEALLLHMNGAS